MFQIVVVNRIGVKESRYRFLKTYPVPFQIDFRFANVPFKSHG
jgi:hypothetical protein